MPQITGCELANKITEINSRIEMVLITSANDIVNNNEFRTFSQATKNASTFTNSRQNI